MLLKVFHMFVNLPESIAVNIPGLRDPSSLSHLKKVRQKIKTKLKIAKTQLKSQQELLKKVESSLVSNENVTVYGKHINEEINVIPNTNLDYNHSFFAEDLCNQTNLNENNATKLSHLQSTCNLKTEVIELSPENNTCTNFTNFNETKNEVFVNPMLIPSTSTSKSILNNSMCYESSININLKNNEINYYNSPNFSSDNNGQHFNSNVQIKNKSKQ